MDHAVRALRSARARSVGCLTRAARAAGVPLSVRFTRPLGADRALRGLGGSGGSKVGGKRSLVSWS
jgi:hypothetical protein